MLIVITGVKTREIFLTRHKFTKLLIVSKFWLFSLLDLQEMAFLHEKWSSLFLKKLPNEINSSLKSRSTISHSLHIFFFVHAPCTTISSSNWKNNNTILMVSKIHTTRKLNNPTTTLFTGLFLTILRYNLLEW